MIRFIYNPSQSSTNMPSIVSQAIPATVPILGGSNPEGKVEDEGKVGPPNRPENDIQIEEFVREQHRSKFVGETDEGSNL